MQPPFPPAAPLYAILVSLAAVPLIILSGKRPNLREFWTFLAAAVKFGLILSMASYIKEGHTYSYTLITRPRVPSKR